VKARHLVALVVCGLLLAASVPALALPITGQLTGDPRTGSPDNLIVDVSISAVGSLATFIVDLNSPLHPGVKLDAFYFNVAIPTSQVSLFSVLPAGWALGSGANAHSSGGADFDFSIADAPGGPKNNVTNSIDLVFTLQKSTGAWLDSDFLGAEATCSGDDALGCGQMGAHLQSLSTAGCPGCTVSGFALGAYHGPDTRDPVPPTTTATPEPASLALLGSGALGFWMVRRRRHS
jgi:hypothetical protein